MKIHTTKEQRSWGLIAFCVLSGVALFVMLLLHLGEISAAIKKLLSLFVAFYAGFIIAYLLNPVLKFWENKVFRKIKKPQLRRILGLLVTYLLYTLVLGGALAYLIPQLITNITGLVNGIPAYYQAFSTSAIDFIEEHPSINEFYQNYAAQINGFIEQAVKFISSYLSSLLPKVASATIQVGSFMLNFFIGTVISVYFLYGKEKIIAKCKKMLNLIFRRKEHYQRVLDIAALTHQKTLHFIIAQLTDACVVAVLSYTVMRIFQFPYALLNALILGIFNTIPYFGPWIGGVPPAIIILIVKPRMFVPYIIFVILLQQLDGNIIGPRIQGQQMGLSALWIRFAIFLFGGLFGFPGMVFGVPIFAVIYYFVSAAVTNGLQRQGKPTETADYAPPEDRKIIEEESKKTKE